MSKELIVDNSVPVSKPQLEGYNIHSVEFKGVDKTDITSPKDGTVYKVVVLKFENDKGTFRSTIFEPKDEDYTRRPSQFGGANPSRVEIILDCFKQLIAAVNPTLAAEIASGAKVFRFKNWEELRVAFVENTKDQIGAKTEIKLEKNKKGEAQFPAFPLTIDRDGVLKNTSTYIGNNLGWTAKELKAKNSYVMATPTPMARPSMGLDLDGGVPAAKSSSDDLDLSTKGLAGLDM